MSQQIMTSVQFVHILLSLTFPLYIFLFAIFAISAGKVEKELFGLVAIVELMIILLAISFFDYVRHQL